MLVRPIKLLLDPLDERPRRDHTHEPAEPENPAPECVIVRHLWALFDKVGATLDEFVAALAPLPRQVAAVFFVNGHPAGLELFDAASTWRKLSPKRLRRPRWWRMGP
jgi:hypothetical protein